MGFLYRRIKQKENKIKKKHCRGASSFVQCNPPDEEMMLVIQGYVYGDVGIGLTSRNDFGSCFPQPEVGEESSAGSRMYLTTQKEHPADSFISFHESRSFTLVKKKKDWGDR